MKCFFNLNDHRRIGTVVNLNAKTVWVKVVFGCNTTQIIKRHLAKHNVRFMPCVTG